MPGNEVQLKSDRKCVIIFLSIFSVQREKEVFTVRDGKYITIMSDRTQLVLNASTILSKSPRAPSSWQGWEQRILRPS